MKNTFFTIVLALLSLLFFPNISFGQLYEVSLDEKIEKSTLIVEGKVVETKCFRIENGDIYTANKIEVASLLKGQFQNRFLTVTTWGGELDEEVQTWTHLLTLKKGDYGLFFLEKTRVESIQDSNFPESFDVFAGLQGFLSFTQTEAKAWIASEPFHTYFDLEKDLFENVARKSGQKLAIVSESGHEIRNGVRYHFKNIAFNGVAVTFNIYVNSLVGNKKLYKSGIQIGYNPVFFGSNIATNGNLVMQDAGISNSSTYDLSQSNVTSSKVKIELLPVGTLTGLTEISTTEQLLAKGQITIQNIFADPSITYGVAEMQAMSKFYEDGLAQIFDTVIVDGDWRVNNSCSPEITSVSPKTIRGGTGDIITIKGSCFKEYEDGLSDLWFTDASKGFAALQWMFPLKSEFDNGCFTGSLICWTDTLIMVRVPSVSNFSPDSSNLGLYAGTGRILVYNSESLTPGISPEAITVRVSAKNGFTKKTENPSSISLKQTLRDANNNGGFTLTLGSTLASDADAKARFFTALKNWKCTTKINFDTLSSFPNNNGKICSINFGTTPSGALGTTQESYFKCKKTGASGDYIRIATSKFTMIFSDSEPFYKGENPSGIGATQFDLESVALHELGHAHTLNHVNQIDDVMYYSLDDGFTKRVLQPDDIEGGLYIMGISKASYPGTNCTFNSMSDADISGLGCSTPVNEPEKSSVNFSLYPNPSNNDLAVKISNDIDADFECILKINNCWGENLFQNKVVFEQNKAQKIDISDFATGVYFIFFELEGKQSHILKFVKI